MSVYRTIGPLVVMFHVSLREYCYAKAFECQLCTLMVLKGEQSSVF